MWHNDDSGNCATLGRQPGIKTVVLLILVLVVRQWRSSHERLGDIKKMLGLEGKTGMKSAISCNLASSRVVYEEST